ncbi:hypothetical protein GX51_05113 [Blastomyces parvus]|uniref:Uncharacterized protein n=1 Tax=Blastomyces parvus TaxID=2060905 RepID=A0A2B7WYL6_9EURO|nr:hypothetical protein GX51_05113 [Blastomyces parvus]
MDSNHQDSPSVENTIQSTCHSRATTSSTESPTINTWPSPQQSGISTPASTCEAPEDADGDQQPATPPTPKPWQWRCHRCYGKYSVEATTRCLRDGHYFCSNSQSKRNRRRKYKRQDKRICINMFDYTGWKKMRAWQKQWRQGQGTKEERESGCMNGCGSPGYCKRVAPTPPCMADPVPPEEQLDIKALAALSLNDSNDPLSSEKEEDDDPNDKVRAGSKRRRPIKINVPPEAPPAKRRMLTLTHLDIKALADLSLDDNNDPLSSSEEEDNPNDKARAGSKRTRPIKINVPSEAPPAKRLMLTFTRLDKPTKIRLRDKPLLIGSPLKVTHCFQTTFFNLIAHARDIGI